MGTIEISKDSIEIEYLLTDESFDHELGTEVRSGYQVEFVRVYVDDIDEWLDVTDLYDSKLTNKVNKLIEDDMSQRGMS